MKRLALLALLLAVLASAPAALAHPLGNFTTNRYSELDVSGDRVYVIHVVDLAEIPTFQLRGRVREFTAAIPPNLRLTADGRRLSLRLLDRTIRFPKGVGNLKTTRVESVLAARLPDRDGVLLTYRDANFPGRIGWKEVVVRARDGARVLSSSAPARSVSARLRSYPSGLLDSPLDVSSAQARVAPGDAAGPPPTLSGAGVAAPVRVDAESDDGFAELITEDDLSFGVVLIALAVALFWGAAHALTPGHGKAIVAAYLVGSRGKARHAFLLGGIVTVTHTIGVFALGLVTLALSEFVVPEQLYPWLNFVSALLVVGVGLAVLRARYLHARAHRHAHDHHHHHHHHEHARAEGLRGLVAVGISGGLLPCPTALVVLLAAISLHRVGYGLLLIVAFSVGLAAVITAIGLVAVTAKRAFSRMRLDGPLVRALPAVSALVVLGLGVAMTARAVPQLI
jgi:nickel/cobalt transporter (NicO) family protein